MFWDQLIVGQHKKLIKTSSWLFITFFRKRCHFAPLFRSCDWSCLQILFPSRTEDRPVGQSRFDGLKTIYFENCSLIFKLLFFLEFDLLKGPKSSWAPRDAESSCPLSYATALSIVRVQELYAHLSVIKIKPFRYY